MGLLRFTFDDIPQHISDQLFKNDQKTIVIGVIGKSWSKDCNKMVGFQILNEYPALSASAEPKEGNITFYYEKDNHILFVHFETTFDNFILEQMLLKTMEMGGPCDRFTTFYSDIRTRFAKILLFATFVCHIIVLVEPGNIFDVSYLSIFKSLKIIREKYVLKFLPKILKNSAAGQFMGKEGRLCSPRFLFYFETPIDCADEDTKRLEYDVEDEIYKILRNEFIITNNSSMSLFSIPKNKRFVYFNTDATIRRDPLKESIEMLVKMIDRSMNKEAADENEEDFLSPYKGFAKPYRLDTKIDDDAGCIEGRNGFMELLKEHCEEALSVGFDDSMAKYRGKSHFSAPNIKLWFESFKILHRIFIENPDNPEFEPNDADYKLFLENFHKFLDVDESFFAECSEHGLGLAKMQYAEMLPHGYYSSEMHEKMLLQSKDVLLKYARGAEVEACEEKLRDTCTSIWLNGKQQCEFSSLRGNACIMGKHTVHEHSSGVVYVSACNCGRVQGRREDPYMVRQANYEFYQMMAKNCTNCAKLERVQFPVFQPSTSDFKAAELSMLASQSMLCTGPSNQQHTDYTENMMHLSGSQKTQSSHSNISIDSIGAENIEDDDEDEEGKGVAKKQPEVEERTDKAVTEAEMLARQVSTTEYLNSMVHTKTPEGLLPQFPSWSLVCVGPSSIYSHNTGLPEHVQSGFLSGANFLLPWDVSIGLENSTAAVAHFEKTRHHHHSRKKAAATQLRTTSKELHKYCNLKIFVGVEYECPRGHRFIMNSPTTVLRSSSEIDRDCGNKVVFNDMPIYFACPCRAGGTKPSVAQLMRVHIVTPKAPVNILLDPKVEIFGHDDVPLYFCTGLPAERLKLSQSTYWILRLPYVYHGEDGVLPTPTELPNDAVLMAGMYGIKECE